MCEEALEIAPVDLGGFTQEFGVERAMRRARGGFVLGGHRCSGERLRGATINHPGYRAIGRLAGRRGTAVLLACVAWRGMRERVVANIAGVRRRDERLHDVGSCPAWGTPTKGTARTELFARRLETFLSSPSAVRVTLPWDVCRLGAGRPPSLTRQSRRCWNPRAEAAERPFWAVGCTQYRGSRRGLPKQPSARLHH
ncbi:hypothetical protein BVI434_1040018 [Burkholderia vietnamiensis]|nr:hypothetical protein BVI434_1040018 [Burkholderia vietnamiensis]